MYQQIKPKLLSTSIAMALVAVAFSAPATAQERDEASMLEEVIVTAQKRAESIMDVPISITALGREEVRIYSSGGDDIRFLRGRVPSLNIESSFGRLFPRFYIRGWGNTDFDINASQPVSLVYDDVVMENPILKGFPIFDIESVEVLRGPQGTLFGRNTPAGVVSVRSTLPSQEQTGYASLAYLDNEYNVEGAFGGGLGENWSTRLSVKYMDRDDWVDNTFTGEEDALGGHEELAARWQLMFETDTFNALFNLHYRDLDGTARLFRANIIEPGSEGRLVDGFDIESISVDGQNEQNLEQWGGLLRLQWDFGTTSLISVTGYETLDNFSVGDIDGGFGGVFEVGTGGPGFLPFAAETGDGISDHAQWSQEFRWTSNDWGRLDWTAGFFYFDEDVDIYTLNYATNFGGGVNGDVTQSQQTEAWALFGSIDYDFTDEIIGKFGVRYSDETKDYVAQRFLSPIAFTGAPNEFGPVFANTDDSTVTWDASITRFFTEQTSSYVRVAKGFRAPSIQGRILFGDIVSVADTEVSHSFELGVKSDFNDNRGRVAGNVFYYTVDDIQLTAVGGGSNFNRAINADDMIGYGFEMDFDYLVTDNFLVSAALSYNETEIQDEALTVQICGAPAGCTVVNPIIPGTDLAQIDGNPLPQAPEWIFNTTARWSMDIGGGEFYIFGDYFYRDNVNFFLYDALEFRGQALWELGLRAGYIFGDSAQYEVAAFGRNITDETVIVGAIDFNNLTGFVNEPRRWGGEFRVNF
jgi:iron complex outermembrane receptor protein